MTLEDRLEELKKDVGAIKEIAEDNQRMLEAICETLSINKTIDRYGSPRIDTPDVPLRERLDLLIGKTQKESEG